MKMANMDAVFDFMFTGVRDKFRVSCNCDINNHTVYVCILYI